jgi:hypothetical protein
MKFVKLVQSAYVNGLLRHPHEGALHLEDEEANRLLELGKETAIDVTADFSAKENKSVPAEHLETDDGRVAAALGSEAVPHQVEIAPEAAGAEPAPKPKRRG